MFNSFPLSISMLTFIMWQAATTIPAPHSYSNAYGAEMKQHYNELQSQAKQFQVQRSSGHYGKIRKKIVRKAAGREWVDESLSEWPESMTPTSIHQSLSNASFLQMISDFFVVISERKSATKC